MSIITKRNELEVLFLTLKEKKMIKQGKFNQFLQNTEALCVM